MSRIHNKPSGTNCDECGKTFLNSYNLRIHLFAKHKIQEPGLKVYHCPIEDCKFSCTCKQYIQRHLIKHRSEKPYACNICGKQFKIESGVEKHMKKVHLRIRNFVCEVCGMSYGEGSELKTHMDTHNTTKTYQCEMCEYATYSKGNFKTHLYGRHSVKLDDNMKIFQCSLCSFTSNVKYQFSNHMRVHDNIRDIACTQCDKKFVTRKSMWGHMRKVHCPKDFHCNVCPYKASVNSKLQQHIRNMHTHPNYKPFKCAYCTGQFNERWKCKNHILEKHKGEEVRCIKLDEQSADVRSKQT